MADDEQDDLSDRRKRLESELGALKNRKGAGERNQPKTTDSDRREMSKALKLSSEFISAVFVGFILGYLLDRFAGTGPWGMIILLLLGFCAGVLNVLRSVGYVAEPEDRIDREQK